MTDTDQIAADRILAVLLDARRELTLADLWTLCPGVKRRVVRRCAERLTDEGVLKHKTVFATPGGSEIVAVDLWWHHSVTPPRYIRDRTPQQPLST